jgi:hypothetical protein
MTEKGFMDGFSADLPLPNGWVKGQLSISIEVICCPDCASVHVSQRDNGKGENYIWWECATCRFRFRLPRRPPIKCYVIS